MYASLEYREAHAEEHSITWAQPPLKDLSPSATLVLNVDDARQNPT